MSGEKVICRRISDGVYLRIPDTFDLRQIAESGQCFRLTPTPNGGYIAVTGTHLVEIASHEDGGYIFHCPYEEFRDVWIPYFDLTADYKAYQQKMVGDPFLRKAIAAGGGIRILRQDFWEMVVTFTISQRNSIPRIRKTVDTLCQMYGTPLREVNGQMFYSFPRPEQLKGKDLPATLGYRKDYIKELTEYSDGFWKILQTKNDEIVWRTLTSMRGIGEKVANCVMLFGLHRMDRYPVDVWINRMNEEIYHGEFDPAAYAGFAGYVQQLQFFYYRLIVKEGSE